MCENGEKFELDQDAPIEEVLISIQFDDVFPGTVFHLGRFWGRIADQYPQVIERTSAAPSTNGSSLEVDTRLLSADKVWILQLKRRSLALSWVRGNQLEYPGFDKVRSRFLDSYEQLSQYCETIGARAPWAKGAHLTYINFLPFPPPGVEAPLAFLFKNLYWGEDQKLSPPPVVDIQARYPFPSSRGVLSTVVRTPVLREAIGGVKPFILFQLTSQIEFGKATRAHDEILDWLQEARDFTNIAFNDLLSNEAIKLYCRERKEAV